MNFPSKLIYFLRWDGEILKHRKCHQKIANYKYQLSQFYDNRRTPTLVKLSHFKDFSQKNVTMRHRDATLK